MRGFEPDDPRVIITVPTAGETAFADLGAKSCVDKWSTSQELLMMLMVSAMEGEDFSQAFIVVCSNSNVIM